MHRLLPIALLAGCAATSPPSKSFDVVPEAPAPQFVVEWDAQVDEVPFFATKPAQVATPGHLPTSDELVVGNSRGEVVKYQAANGNALWRAKLDGPITGKPTAAVGHVFVGSARGEFVALDVHSGERTWATRLANSVDSAATQAEGRVFVVDAADSVYAFDALTGESLWSYTAPVPEYFTVAGSPRPVVHEGEVYVGASDGVLRAFQAESGEIIWSVDLGAGAEAFTDIDREVVVDGDMIYAASYSGGIFGVDRLSGDIVWHHKAAAVGDFAVYEGMVYATSANNRAFAVLAENGKPVWGFKFRDAIPASVTVYGPYLVVPTDGSLYLLDRRTGYPMRKVNAVSNISGDVEFGADRAYFLTDLGRLTAFKLGW